MFDEFKKREFKKFDNYIILLINKFYKGFPDDIINIIFKEIVKNINNIEYRMYCGLYNKINLNNYLLLDTIIRKNKYGLTANNGYNRFYFKNLHEFNARKTNDVEDDMLDIRINVQDHFVDIEFFLFKLKLKNNSSRKELDNTYHKGKLYEYYWDDINYQYRLY